jgi:hypothetical protein
MAARRRTRPGAAGMGKWLAICGGRGLSKRTATGSIERFALAKMQDFREISQLLDKRLVHSQKNHDLAFDSANLSFWQGQQDKRKYLFLNE